jgi:hypothetical protein
MRRERFDPFVLEKLMNRLRLLEESMTEISSMVRLMVYDLNDRNFELECSHDDWSSNGTSHCNFTLDNRD